MAGCREKTDCPPYSEEYLNWMPYQQGERFSFTDGEDTFKLNVDETFRSSAYTITQPMIAKKPCEADAYARISGDSFLPKIEVVGTYRSNIEPGQITYVIEFLNSEYSTFIFIFENETFYDISLMDTLLKSYDNGYEQYNNVLKLESDTTVLHHQQIYQVCVAESVGIIQFKDIKNHKTWSLVEE